MNILVIDDDIRSLEIMSFAFDLLGLPHQAFSDPREAVEAYKRGNFDVVVSDFSMPEMTGLDVFRTVKEHDPQVKVIILTGYPFETTAMKEIREKAYAFFHKPFEINIFMNAINAIGND
ncbi:response regulator [bacterium]|nr:response regulator [bacterium]